MGRVFAFRFWATQGHDPDQLYKTVHGFDMKYICF